MDSLGDIKSTRKVRKVYYVLPQIGHESIVTSLGVQIYIPIGF